jgi:hypothetical protein
MMFNPWTFFLYTNQLLYIMLHFFFILGKISFFWEFYEHYQAQYLQSLVVL